jgi:L-ornithine N5-monooxygenase
MRAAREGLGLPACYDILGIGLGPANLALAIALEECLPTVAPHFLEARPDPLWQDGMLLSGSNIQNHPVRDLVTLRNPRSRYTFINYLFEEKRLLAHLNLPVEFPLRKEYAQYVSWTARQFSHVTDFGAKVDSIRLEQRGGEPVYVATTVDGDRHAGRALVVAPGRTPYVPAPFDKALGPRVFHLTDYLFRIVELPAPPRRVAVIGGSQSAVELTLDLAKRFPEAEIVNYTRSFGFRLKDTSPFSEEGYFPEFTTYYYRADRATKQHLDAYMRPTNYSSADADVLHELYLLLYEQRLDGKERLSVRGNRQAVELDHRSDRLHLTIQEVNTGEIEHAEFDCIVVATGFRDLGPAKHQERYPALLDDVIDRFAFDDDGYMVVNEDYSLEATVPGTPPLFLNGLCESSHGIGDSGSFSLLAPRAATILRGYLARSPAPVDGAVGGDYRTGRSRRLRELEETRT